MSQEQKKRFGYKPHSEKASKGAVIGVSALIILYSFYLIGNLYKTTVKDYDQYAKSASDNQWRLITYKSDRGVIYDANMNPLASNTYDYTVVCTPNMVRSDVVSRQQIIQGFVDILGVDYQKMDSILPVNPDDENDPKNAVLGCDVIKNVPSETKDKFDEFLKENKIKGVNYVAVPQRYYNYSTLASQIIGYANNNGESLNGIYGLEAYYNSELSGTKGYRYSEVDSKTYGVLPYSEATTESAVNGNNLVLNIDVSIQRIAEEACRKAYKKYAPRDGICAIVMNPYTGAVYAMVSLPDYNLNEPYAMPYGMTTEVWSQMSTDEQIKYVMSNCWRNRCVSDTYEPGSTFKAITTAIAFEENLTNEEEMFSDAPIQISTKHKISCWLQKTRHYNHGDETLTVAFQNSCNPIFTQLAERIGLSKYYSYVRMLGFYDKTGIDLPAEGKGIIHKEPTKIDMDVLSYGESATVTPIQLIMSYCAIINGGNLMVPHIVKNITDAEGNIVDEIEPEVVRTVFSEQTCARVRGLMEKVVSDGTGSAGQVPGYKVAGKTSTSTIETGELKGAHVLSFSCYAPSDNPQIAVLVVLNKPADDSVGSSAAASTAAEIVGGTLTYMGVQRKFSAEEYDKMLKLYYVQDGVGETAAEAASDIAINGLTTIYGTADMTPDTIVGSTYPDDSHRLYTNGVVVLYPEGITKDQMMQTRVPNMNGMSAIECIEACKAQNLNCYVEGDVTGICVSQSVSSGSVALAGDIIKVQLSSEVSHVSGGDDTNNTDTENKDKDGGNDASGEDGVVATKPKSEEEEQ